MRIVVCDEDALMREMVEALVSSTGHEVAGTADTTAAAVGLIEAGRPDAVVLDLSLGYNTDFDIIESAIAVGARAIVFSHHADAELLSGYSVQPAFVPKPDLNALEQLLARLDRDDPRHDVVEQDRRHRPARAASGPSPTGIGDAQAFFEALNDAQPGDAMVTIDVSDGAEAVAADVARRLRDTDRLLLFPRAVRLYLPGSDEDGIRSLLRRVADIGGLTPDCRAASIIVREGEAGADAFDRLKHHGEEQPLPPGGRDHSAG